MADRDIQDTFSQVSQLLMGIFRKLGVNKKIRRIRKNKWKQGEQMKSFISKNVLGTCNCVMVFGSQIEGSTTPGLQSDLDTVVCNLLQLAVRNIQDAVPGINNFHMVTDEHTFPGYFKLHNLILTQDGFIPLYGGDMDLGMYHTVDCKGRIVFRNSIVSSMGGSRHGPANTFAYGLQTFDIIRGIRVNSWVQEAVPWLMRHRQCSWITPDDLENFLRKEAFLVPVGHSFSDEEELEWRISFTEIERKLMWRLNNTQMTCYILMKIIKKCFITPIIGECLSSYHCKTALFYLIDNTAKILWKPNNLLSCLKLLLKTICEWVKEGFCPNYFIPQENIFLGKLTGPLRHRLYQILVSLIDMEFTYLLLIDCDHLGQALSNACSRLSTLQEIPSDIEHLVTVTENNTAPFCISFLFASEVYDVLRSGYNELLKLSGQNVSQGFIFTLLHGLQTGSRHLKDMLSPVTAFLSSHIGCQLASSCFASQNFHPQDMDKVHKFLLLGTGSDVTSGKLKLAGFYLKLGYPAQAEAVLSAVEQELVHHVSEVEVQCHLDIELKDTTKEKIMSENLTTTQIFQTCIAASVTYLPSEIHITLPPLYYEMFWSVGADSALRDPVEHYYYDWAVVDARSYLYFLQYQTYSALGMNRHRLVALENLSWSIHDKRTFHDTCLNLLAYCLRQEGFLELALMALFTSLCIKPEHNAAVWQICDLFNQLYYS